MQVDGKVIPRPLGSALHEEKPNKLIHFAWLSMPTSKTGLKYVLVIKGDMSGFVYQFPAESSDATATATALMSWFRLYGCVDTWVTDGSSPVMHIASLPITAVLSNPSLAVLR
jgi:hypothetical protein